MNFKQAAAFRGNFHVTFAKLCEAFDLPKTSDERHKIAEWILGYHKSSSQWSGKEYSLVIDQMKDWMRGDIQPHKLNKNQIANASHDEEKKQLIHAIKSYGYPDAMIQKISDDQFGSRPWKDHGVLQLKRLRMTVNARSQKRK